MSFDIRRLINQHVRVRDRTGAEYEGFVKEIHLDAVLLADGNGTSTLLSRSHGNIVSVKVFM